MLRIGSWFAALLVAAALLGGCSDEDPGTAPAISDLTYDPASGTAGAQVTITGQFTFSDPDADVESYTIELAGPGNLAQTIGPQVLQGAAGQTSGSVGITLILTPPVAGDYTFDVWLSDVAGNESNRLTGTYTAQ